MWQTNWIYEKIKTCPLTYQKKWMFIDIELYVIFRGLVTGIKRIWKTCRGKYTRFQQNYYSGFIFYVLAEKYDIGTIWVQIHTCNKCGRLFPSMKFFY